MRRMREGNPSNIEDSIDYAFRLALARAPKPAERERLAEYLAQQAALYQREPGAATALLANDSTNAANESIDPAAWTALCSVILNLDEFITRE
jgi:hypothetical protein